jgi:hypothetical protein
MIQERLNKVIGTFTVCFGLSPDIVFHENGKFVAFRIFGRNNALISLVAKENENGNVICTARVEKFNRTN